MTELSPHDPGKQHRKRRRGGARVGRRLHEGISLGFLLFVSRILTRGSILINQSQWRGGRLKPRFIVFANDNGVKTDTVPGVRLSVWTQGTVENQNLNQPPVPRSCCIRANGRKKPKFYVINR